MKKIYALSIYLVLMFMPMANIGAQKTTVDSLKMLMDSINRYFTYEKGKIDLSNGVASLIVPSGFGFLNGEKSQKLLSDFWGNVPDESVLGMLFPENVTPLDSNAWGFVISYDQMGYVKDDDAKDINYDDLLKTMKEDTNEGNKEREKLGYGKVELVGWGSTPFYDENKKVLHWAKELKFDGGIENTLNYDLRILG
jgi:uncharacterized membrane-anchored protein